MWSTRSSGDAGVGMRLVGLSAGWVGTGGWGMRRMDAGVGSFPITDRQLSANSRQIVLQPRRFVSASRALAQRGKILSRRFTQCFLEHRDECINRVISQDARHTLHGYPLRQMTQCDHQMQLLTPASEAQPGRAFYKPGQRPFTGCKPSGPLAQSGSVAWI